MDAHNETLFVSHLCDLKHEITVLEWKVKSRDELAKVRNEIITLIGQAENRSSNELKVEKEKLSCEISDVTQKIEEANKEIKRKATQRDLDRLSNQQKLHQHPTTITPITHPDKNSDKTSTEEAPEPEQYIDVDIENNLANKPDLYTNKSQTKRQNVINAEAILLMDSNNKFINEGQFWQGRGKTEIITTYPLNNSTLLLATTI